MSDYICQNTEEHIVYESKYNNLHLEFKAYVRT